MDKNSEKVKLNDELLDKVSGGRQREEDPWKSKESDGKPLVHLGCPNCKCPLTNNPDFHGVMSCPCCMKEVEPVLLSY